MTTIYEARVPRKRIATYGKAARKRVPDHSFQKLPQDTHLHKIQDGVSVLPGRHLAGGKLGSLVKGAALGGLSPALPKPSLMGSVPTTSGQTAPPGVKPAMPFTRLQTGEDMDRTRKKSGLRKSSPASSTAPDIFDVPSSDNEVEPAMVKSIAKTITTPRYKPKLKDTYGRTITAMKQKNNKEGGQPLSGSTRKTSPSRTTKTSPKSTKQDLNIQAAESNRTRKANRQTRMLMTKPTHLSPDVELSPRKSILMGPNVTATLTLPEVAASPSLDSAAVMNEGGHASLTGSHPWEQLSHSRVEHRFEDASSYRKAQAINDGESFATGPTVISPHTLKRKKACAAKFRDPHELPSILKRRRLIDSLVEQTVDQEDAKGMVFDLESNGTDGSNVHLDLLSEVDARKRSYSPEVAKPSIPTPGSQASSQTGPKFTYSRQRSMLAEEDPLQELDSGLSYHAVKDVPPQRRPRRGSMPILQPLPSFAEETEDNVGEATVLAVRSVHELRQAGANKRFLDEIDDILDRIATPASPLSPRRSGLLELAEKMRDKEFVRQFRANGVEQRLFLHLGQETDLVSAYLMVSLLITLLADASMPHIVTQLRRQGIARLLIRLLQCERSILTISKERTTNMSGIAKSLLLGRQDFLLQLPIWDELQPQKLLPCTAALKCLVLMVRQKRDAGDLGEIFSKELTTKLFGILKTVTDDAVWALPNGERAIDFYLALSALESHSIVARTARDESIWISQFLPVIALALKSALTRPVDELNVLQLLILRLTLNVTNNNPTASDVFAKEGVMAIMGQTIVRKFISISRPTTEEGLSLAVDHLILVLGVMINFVESSPAAREDLQHCPAQVADSFDSMIQLFMDNQERASEAESVEESEKNVAFGYLSVLLGYLCLVPAIADLILARQPRTTIRPLIASIEEFILHHKAVDDLIQAADDGQRTHTGLTERLENLVTKLGGSRILRQ